MEMSDIQNSSIPSEVNQDNSNSIDTKIEEFLNENQGDISTKSEKSIYLILLIDSNNILEKRSNKKKNNQWKKNKNNTWM